VSAAPGDAVTAFALELRDLLGRIGPSTVHALHIDPELAGDVRPLRDDAATGSAHPGDDLLVYHASIGSPEVFDHLMERPERIVLVYHNISPPAAFAPYEPAFAGLLEAGRRELAQLRDRTALAIGVSAFNASELIALGYDDVRVSPLIVDPAALHGVEVDEGTAHHLAATMDGPMVLFVGQVLPHKRPELLVQAFHALSTYLAPDASLVMVGSHRLAQFAQAVQQEIVELALHRAWMAGTVPPGALRAFYERADLFVTASDHEGFCVPLVEAMSFGIPVVARATTAIPETLGGAGVLVDPSDGPLVMAEAWHAVLTDPALGRSLADAGTRRVHDFDPDRARRQMLGHLTSVL